MITERDKVRILRQNARVLLSSKNQYERKFIVTTLAQFSLLMGTPKDDVTGQLQEIISGVEQNIKADNERIAKAQSEEVQEVSLELDDLVDEAMQM